MSDGNNEAGKWPTAESLSGWEWTEFSEVFDNVTSSDLKLKQKEYVDEGPLPVVDQGQELIGGYTDQAELRHPSELPVVLFGDHTQCVKYLDFPFVQGADGTKVLKPTECVEPRFAYWSMRTIDLPKRGYSRHFKFLRDSKFPLPPRPEQRRIVSKIESLQERSSRAREALSEVGPLLEQFRQSVLQAAFSGRLTADWRAANPDVEPATELLSRIRTERRHRWEQAELAKYEAKGKQPPKSWKGRYVEPPTVARVNLPGIPVSWAWTTLDDLTELITSGSRAWSKYYNKGDGTFIMAQNVRPGRLDFSDVRQLVGPPEGDSDRRRSQVKPGDLLVTIVGANTGDICPVEEELPEHWVCQSVALLRLVMPEMYGLVLRYFLRGGGGRLRFDQVIYGQGRPHLGFDDLRTMPVPVPPLEEQAELLSVIGDCEESMDAVEAGLAQLDAELTQLDQSILAKAFRGELVPQDSNDEPASVLLQRIREQREAATADKTKRRR